jgi:predicted DNA-binding protein
LKSAGIPKPSSTTTCATFRLPKEKLEQLRKVSQTKNVTPNTLVNQIINSYLDWHSRAAHAKLYYLPKSFLIRLLNELTEKELNELARDVAKNDLVDISLFLRGGFNIASISEIAETWLRVAQMSHRVEVAGDIYKIIIEHDMGRKYSYLIKEISRYLLEIAFETKSSCDVTENAVIVKIWR